MVSISNQASSSLFPSSFLFDISSGYKSDQKHQSSSWSVYCEVCPVKYSFTKKSFYFGINLRDQNLPNALSPPNIRGNTFCGTINTAAYLLNLLLSHLTKLLSEKKREKCSEWVTKRVGKWMFSFSKVIFIHCDLPSATNYHTCFSQYTCPNWKLHFFHSV